MGDLLLGIDVGTYSTKGVLVEPNGNILKSHVVQHKMDIPKPGWAEQDADKVWWHDFVEVCRALLDGAPYSGDDVGGVACSAIGPCMLPLDKAGKPLRPGILYGVDTRAREEIDILNKEFGEEAIFKFSGMNLSSQAVGPKILWMKNNEPELWKQVDYITTASSYLVYRLTGEKVIDKHTASHYMPLIDINTLEWSDKFSQGIVDLDKLPRMQWSDELAGEVSASAAEETGLKEGTAVAVGAVDALSEGISVGVVQPGDLMIMYGSTAYFIMVTNEPQPDPRVWTVAGAYEGQYNLDAGMATTGSLTRWFRDELAQELPDETAYKTLFERAEKIQPGSNGLLVLPYFSGERTPINDPDARGIIIGLTLSHSRNHIYRAVLEGVAFGIRHNLETFKEMGANVERIVAVGGGTQSSTWLQIVSDVLGLPHIVPEKTIGASYGDAFLAGLAKGTLKRDDIEEWVAIKQTIEPDKKKYDVYNGLYGEYRSLYGQTKKTMHYLAEHSRSQ
ncbi:MAG: sugar kinase [Chloroflexi bacterium]|nr:MAG: sugar kinase [Chloroflexota bacterium]MBL1193436.1 sugar kinase [Chloroflexota bacterium]NOH10727.1 FGGY-family carbohydrate kinase [Chloroflexota bacterium]